MGEAGEVEGAVMSGIDHRHADGNAEGEAEADDHDGDDAEAVVVDDDDNDGAHDVHDSQNHHDDFPQCPILPHPAWPAVVVVAM